MNDREFEKVYTRYHRAVYAYLLTLCHNEQLAADLAQDTFYKALSAIDRFDGRCPLNVWLCRIARNTWVSHLRHGKREVPLEDAAADAWPCPAPGPEQAAEGKEGMLRIHRALHALAEPYREVFWLRVYGELSFAEIALLFQKTESWARVTFYRAKTKLKEELQ